MNTSVRNVAIWVSIVLTLATILMALQPFGQLATLDAIPFSQLLHGVEHSRVRDVLIQGSRSPAPSPTAAPSRLR